MSDIDWPEEIFREFKTAGIGQVAYVPDAGHRHLIQRCIGDDAIEAVSLTTEEEGIAVLAGAWLGGVKGALLMQSSGVGNCINMLSLARVCRFPLLMLVTMRGEWGEFNPWQNPMGQMTPGLLQDCGMLVKRVDDPAEVGPGVASMARMVFEGSEQGAILISQSLIGAKTFGK